MKELDELNILKEYMCMYCQILPHSMKYGGSIHHNYLPKFEEFKRTYNDKTYSMAKPVFKDEIVNLDGYLFLTHTKGLAIAKNAVKYRFYNSFLCAEYFTGLNIKGEYTNY